NANKCAQFLIVEADAAKRVRILAYDLITEKFFPQQWDIPKAWEKSEFTYDSHRAGAECSPYFDDLAEPVISNISDGGFDLTIPQENIDAFYVDAYYVRITDEKGRHVKTVSFWSEYYFADMPEKITQRIDGLDAGQYYEMEIWATGFWGKKSVNRLYGGVGL
ncbi:MAG: hypothetical protein II350_00455, partial [Clostridia bacterium]|nr:hypothetical protein [Clostridia bacterium]